MFAPTSFGAPVAAPFYGGDAFGGAYNGGFPIYPTVQPSVSPSPVFGGLSNQFSAPVQSQAKPQAFRRMLDPDTGLSYGYPAPLEAGINPYAKSPSPAPTPAPPKAGRGKAASPTPASPASPDQRPGFMARLLKRQPQTPTPPPLNSSAPPQSPLTQPTPNSAAQRPQSPDQVPTQVPVQAPVQAPAQFPVQPAQPIQQFPFQQAQYQQFPFQQPQFQQFPFQPTQFQQGGLSQPQPSFVQPATSNALVHVGGPSLDDAGFGGYGYGAGYGSYGAGYGYGSYASSVPTFGSASLVPAAAYTGFGATTAPYAPINNFSLYNPQAAVAPSAVPSFGGVAPVQFASYGQPGAATVTRLQQGFGGYPGFGGNPVAVNPVSPTRRAIYHSGRATGFQGQNVAGQKNSLGVTTASPYVAAAVPTNLIHKQIAQQMTTAVGGGVGPTYGPPRAGAVGPQSAWF